MIITIIYHFLSQKLKSAIKSDRNWGPEDPMLQHQWHQINKQQSDQGDGDTMSKDEECKESKNVKVIMKRLFASSTPNTTSKNHGGI